MYQDAKYHMRLIRKLSRMTSSIIYNSSVNIEQRILDELGLNNHTEIKKISIDYFKNLMKQGGQRELTVYAAIEIATKLKKEFPNMFQDCLPEVKEELEKVKGTEKWVSFVRPLIIFKAITSISS